MILTLVILLNNNCQILFEGPKTLLNEDELGILEQLARERGESPETYRKRVRCHIDK